uniref:Uncharacterized protein n=1 Tax=Corethron hystrix TaxID=216773 RepID=A0A7S1B407_9STRA|mmetsp:Transcript_11034/g.24324  ORF Transcript_11034/g.24324 Transcript_11034/m.24324 type:complete len:327 (+) Transcript_11034:143-1123(+)
MNTTKNTHSMDLEGFEDCDSYGSEESDSDSDSDSNDEMYEDDEDEDEVVKSHADHKIDGNDCYRLKDYRTAIAHYTLAILTAEGELSNLVNNEGDLKNNDDKEQVSSVSSMIAQYYGNRSAAQSMLLKHTEVIADCDAALRHDPLFVKAYFRKARAEVLLGRVDAAAKTFTAGLIKDPSNAAARKEKTDALNASRRYDLAKELLSKFEASGGKRRTDARQCLAQVEAALAVCPNWQDAKLVRAEALCAVGRSEEAYAATGALMRSAAANSGTSDRTNDLLIVRAKCLYQMGNLDDSMKHLRQVRCGAFFGLFSILASEYSFDHFLL